MVYSPQNQNTDSDMDKNMDKKEQRTDFKKLSQKWNKIWEEEKTYQPDLKSAKKPYYNLYMFPYPSAEGLHVGHAFSGTGADIHSRFQRMKGNDVFQPMGFDAFGIHSENFALKIGDHPKNLIDRATRHFKDQFDSLGFSYDWSHSVNTSHPDYYKWTQWVFTTLFKTGLVVKKKAAVNWCPKDKTVLADEQVIAGRCERCQTLVETRELDQWFFRITEYSEKLLEGLDRIDWSEKVVLAQRNWIGKSEGAKISFKIADTSESLEVFTTRPDTLFGATFMVVSPQHPILENIKRSKELENYINVASDEKALEEEKDKEKTGVFTGLYAINPVNNQKIPVWCSDYVLMTYGTGAIMAVPAHDQRDYEFAKKFNLPIKEVISGGDVSEHAYEGEGKLINSDAWNGIKIPQYISKVIEDLEKKKIGSSETNYHLRDWLISRQRYWGAPIPMIFCEKCSKAKKSYFNTQKAEVLGKSQQINEMFGWFPVKDDDLPVLLPYIENFKPLGTGESPLSQDPEFVKVKCPNCGSDAERETDVCDTFLDSSWYFLRYPSTGFDTVPFDKVTTEKWLPVNIYIGGAEHSVLHLLYSRFVTHVLYDLKLLKFDEPFPKFRAHGLIIKEGAKMSKSRGNVVNPDEYVEKFGADAVRMYLMFLGPFNQGGDFRDSGMEGMSRFVKKVTKFVNYQLDGSSDTFLTSEKLDKTMNKTIKSVTHDIENLSYNTSIARIMEYVNELTKEGNDILLSRLYIENLLLILAPFAPYFTEELFVKLSNKSGSIHKAAWPIFDEAKIKDENASIAIQINGKLRDVLIISLIQSENEDEVKKMALESSKIKAYLEGKPVKKTIYIKGKILSIVI